MTEAHVCEQLAKSRYLMVEQLGIEPATFPMLVRRHNHYTAKPIIDIINADCQPTTPIGMPYQTIQSHQTFLLIVSDSS